MNNKFKRLSRSFVCLSFLIGSTVIVLIPVKALNSGDINTANYDMIIKSEIPNINEENIYKDRISMYIKDVEVNIENGNIDEAEKSINIALGYLNKIPKDFINSNINKSIEESMNSINKYKASDFLKGAVINLGNNKLPEAETNLIKAFNYGNQITNNDIRQPIINMIIKVQNQISICGMK